MVDHHYGGVAAYAEPERRRVVGGRRVWYVLVAQYWELGVQAYHVAAAVGRGVGVLVCRREQRVEPVLLPRVGPGLLEACYVGVLPQQVVGDGTVGVLAVPLSEHEHVVRQHLDGALRRGAPYVYGAVGRHGGVGRYEPGHGQQRPLRTHAQPEGEQREVDGEHQRECQSGHARVAVRRGVYPVAVAHAQHQYYGGGVGSGYEPQCEVSDLSEHIVWRMSCGHGTGRGPSLSGCVVACRR